MFIGDSVRRSVKFSYMKNKMKGSQQLDFPTSWFHFIIIFCPLNASIYFSI